MNYFAFGLTIQSDLDFSGVLQPSSRPPDLCISAGQVTGCANQPTNVFRRGVQAQFGSTPTSLVLRWDGIGLFQVSNGSHIVYENLGADAGTLRLFLLSEVIGLALLQRGDLLLHGSAVQVGKGAVVFLGRPGAGKSTTATAFRLSGHTVLSDDLVAIRLINQQPCVIPAFGQFKIWRDAAAGLHVDAASLTPSFEGAAKYLITQSLDAFPQNPVPLRQINILVRPYSRTPGDAIDPVLVPSELLRHFPLPNQALQPAVLKKNFQDSIQVAQHVPVRFLRRPKTFEALMRFARSSSRPARPIKPAIPATRQPVMSS